jgi:hypothetical protein
VKEEKHIFALVGDQSKKAKKEREKKRVKKILLL